jgi:GNAT superfamily N-acetyltransferase
MSSATIRPAVEGDAETVALLLAELGYPLPAAEAEKRLARTEQHVLVAAADGQVIGLLAVSTLLSLTRAKPVLWVNAIVVATGARGHGVGHSRLCGVDSLLVFTAIGTGGTAVIAQTSGGSESEAFIQIYVVVRGQ